MGQPRQLSYWFLSGSTYLGLGPSTPAVGGWVGQSHRQVKQAKHGLTPGQLRHVWRPRVCMRKREPTAGQKLISQLTMIINNLMNHFIFTSLCFPGRRGEHLLSIAFTRFHFFTQQVGDERWIHIWFVSSCSFAPLGNLNILHKLFA